MKLKVFHVLFCIGLLAACKSEKQKLADKINGMEKELKNDTTGVMNFKKAIEMTALYEDYVFRFPGDSVSAKYLYNAADVSAHSHNAEHAIELYRKVIDRYPNSKYVQQSWFFIGFLYENELKNIEEARKAYTALLNKFPDYDQRQTVEWLLQNLGKSDAEIVKQFEAAQQQSNSTADTNTTQRKN